MRRAGRFSVLLAAGGAMFQFGGCLGDAGRYALRLAGEGLITGASRRTGDLLIDEFFLQDLTRDERINNDLDDAERAVELAAERAGEDAA